MQKTNFITQRILKIKLTHYSSSLWACPDMPDHTHLKQPTNICCFHGLQITSKNSASTYLWHILVWRILHSDWPWGFWTIIQEPDISQSCCFCEKLNDHWPRCSKKAYISELIRFLLKSEKLILWGLFAPFKPIWTFIQKPGSVTFLTLGCLTLWKKWEKIW